MEIKRIYNDPVDENDIANKRYVDKNVKAVVDKTIADTVDGIASGKTPLDNLVVGNITSKNLFDEQWGTLGKRYTNSTSVKFATTNASGQVGIVNPIELDRTKSYLIISTNSNYNTNGVYFYDANGIYLRHIYINHRPVPIPENAYYMTFNLTNVTDIKDLANYTWQVEYIDSETATSTHYSKKKKYGYNSRESMGSIVVDDISCKNLFSGFVIGVSLNTTNGSEEIYNRAATSDYIPVDFSENNNYALSGLSNNLYSLVCAYNSSKQFLGRTAGGARTRLILSTNLFVGGTAQGVGDIAYIRITQYENVATSGVISDVNNLNIQLEKGTVPTEYTPYKNFDSTINIVTGEEVATNEYIDGKRKYTKEIHVSSMPTGSSTSMNLISLADISYSKIWLDEGNSYISNASETIGINWFNSSTDFCRTFIKNKQIVFRCPTDLSAFSGTFRICYLK